MLFRSGHAFGNRQVAVAAVVGGGGGGADASARRLHARRHVARAVAPALEREADYRQCLEVAGRLLSVDPLFELESAARQRIEKSITDLRLARLLGSMDRFDAREVSFSSKALGPSPVVFSRKDGKWLRQGGVPVPAPTATGAPVPVRQDDDTKVTSILDRLSGDRVKAFLPERRPGRDALEVSLKDEHSQVLRRIEFWKEGERLLARDLLSKRSESLELDPSLSQALPWEKL